MAKKPLDLDDRLSVMTLITEVQQKERETAHALLFDRASVKAHLAEIYQAQGGVVPSDEVIEKGIDQWLDQQRRFQEPPRRLSTKLAEMYVERGRIFRQRVLPVLALGALTLTAYGGVNAVQAFNEIRAEQKAEETIEKLMETTIPTIQNALTVADTSEYVPMLPANERSNFNSHMDVARAKLSSAREILGEYSFNIEGSVNRTNAPEVLADAEMATSALNESQQHAMAAGDILSIELALRTGRTALEERMGRIRASHGPAPLVGPAHAAYDDGIASLQARNVNGLQAAISVLDHQSQAIHEYRTLSSSAEQLYRVTRGLAAERFAQERVDSLYEVAQASIESVNVGGLRNSLAELREVRTDLEQACTVTIIGGVWRYANENPNAKSYYLRVQCLDDAGNALPVRRRSRETNHVERVDQWAEHVEEEIYNRVGEDKGDDGVIDDNIFGNKARGHLTVSRDSRYPDLGQITQWEDYH